MSPLTSARLPPNAQGTSKTRERLAVVDELLTYWKLDESDSILEELEEALITSGASPARVEGAAAPCCRRGAALHQILGLAPASRSWTSSGGG